MIFEWNKGTKELSVLYDKNYFGKGINVYRTKSYKYVDSTYSVTYRIGGLFISYTNWEYDDILYVTLQSDKKFRNTECADSVKDLLDTLSQFNEPKEKFKVEPPFSFAIECNFDENGDEYHTYYITAKKSWFEENNLECVIRPLLLALKRDEIIAARDKFPPYHKNKKEVIWI